MSFSSTIEATFVTTCYVTRDAAGFDADFNPTTAATTIVYDLRGDVQPAKSSLFYQAVAGSDYKITHMGFFDVPASLPRENDWLVTAGNTYAVRNVRDFKTHLELELERLGR